MRGGRPAARPADERLHVIWPVVQRGRIESGAVGPYERMDLGIEPDLPKKCRIVERPEKFSRQHGFEVDRLRRAVIERDAQRVGTYDLEATNVVDGVVHPSSYFSGSMGRGGRPAWRWFQSDPRVIRKILGHLGLATEVPQPHPSRSLPGRSDPFSDLPAARRGKDLRRDGAREHRE